MMLATSVDAVLSTYRDWLSLPRHSLLGGYDLTRNILALNLMSCPELGELLGAFVSILPDMLANVMID